MTEVGTKEILDIVCRMGEVSDISPEEDFYEAGVSSTASLSILLELEERFGVSIPDDRFVTTRTVKGLEELVLNLQGQA
jgi:acyl carrier protein